jgi:hypothetical protein
MVRGVHQTETVSHAVASSPPTEWTRASLALRIAAAVILLLNLLDASFTLLWTTSGLATEANPLMEQVLSHSPLQFMLVKTALVSLGLLLLWRLRWQRMAKLAIVGSALGYSVLAVYHLSEVHQLVALLQLH